MKHILPSLLILFLSSYLHAQLEAGFVASHTEACNQLQVTFSDQSTNPGNDITAWHWDFGDGSTSNRENPGKLYTRSGIYTVCLIVTSGGDQDTFCREDYIKIYPKPSPDFTPDITIGCTPLTVTFEDLSTSPNGNIDTWIWGLGGTNDVYEQTDSNDVVRTTYTTHDQFSVNLTIIDEKGCVATIVKPDIIETYEKVELDVSIENNTGCNLPLEVEFTNESDPSGDITYTWDFGNGESFEGYQPPPIEYNSAGAFNVTLIAHNDVTGCTDTLTLHNAVLVGGGNVNYNVNQSSGCLPLEVTFNPGAIGGDFEVIWDFGDGTTSTEVTPTHVYHDPGQYEVEFTLTIDGCTYTADNIRTISVDSIPEFQYTLTDDGSCSIPIEYYFNIDGAEYADIEWRIDGYKIEGDSFSRVLDHARAHYVSATIETPGGCTFDVVLDTVTPKQFEMELGEGTYGCYEVFGHLGATATGEAVSDWQWQIVGPGLDTLMSGPSPAFHIADTGMYDVTLIATSESGCVDTITVEDHIGVGMDQDVGFSADVLEGCVSLGHYFTSWTEFPSTSFHWDFDDGSTSDEENPIHEFGDINIFTITFTAYHNGCPSSSTIPDYIETFGPIAGYTYVQNCENPNRIEFYEQGVDFTWIGWDFGDGTVSHELDPVHEYEEPGTYTVWQTLVNDSTGCQHTQPKEIVVPEPLEPGFGIGPIFCSNDELTLVDQSTGAWRVEYFLDDKRIYWGIPPINPVDVNVDFDPSDAPVITQYIYSLGKMCVDSSFQEIEYVDAAFDLDFEVDENPICVGDSLYFTSDAQSLYGDIVFYQWVVNGDTIGFAEDAVMVPLEKGFLTIELLVRDENGCEESIIKVDFVEVVQPTANFESEELGCLEKEISFNTLSQGISLKYTWDFGDGQTGNGGNPKHIYTQEGVYDVTMMIRDAFGCTDEITIPEAVEIFDPVADFEVLDPFGLCPPHVAHFDNNSMHSTSYEWDFGSGFGRSGQENPAHVYTEPGIYDVMLIAERTPACRDTLILPEAVEVRGPEGEVLFEIDSSCAPLGVTFTAESNEPYYYTWDYGNGVLDTFGNRFEMHVTNYTYEEPGIYYPRLIMVDDNSCTRAFDVDDPIVVDDLTVDFDINEGTICDLPATLEIQNLTSASRNNVTYEWTFEGIPGVITDEYPTVTYDEPGTYAVTLVATNGYCVRETTKELINIYERPEPLFDLPVPDPCVGVEVLIPDLTSDDAGEITSRTWYVNGEIVSNDSILTYAFGAASPYEVTLAVETEFGCTQEVTQNVSAQAALEADALAIVDRCGGNTVLSGEISMLSEAIDYYWTVNDTAVCSQCMEFEVVYEEGDLFEFVVINQYGCETRIPAVVEDIPFEGPQISLDDSATVCTNLDAAIGVSGTQTSDQIEWYTSSGTLDCTDCVEVIVNTQTDGWVGVKVTDEFGCAARDTINVGLFNDEFPFGGPDQTVCEDLEVTLNASGADNIEWRGDNIECIDCESITVLIENDAQFYLTARSENNCIIRDTIEVFVERRTPLEASGDTAICPGGEANILASGPGLFEWVTSPYISNPNNSEQNVSPPATTIFEVRGIGDNCVSPDSVIVEVLEDARIELLGDTVCFGESALLIVDGVYDDMEWLNDDIFFEEIGPDLFQVHLDETTNIGVRGYHKSCKSDEDFATIVVHHMEEMDLEMYYEILPGQEVDVDLNIAPSLYDVWWGPDDANHPCPDCFQYTILTDEDLKYNVLIRDKRTGCLDSSLLEIVVKRVCGSDQYYIPNAFSPNGDGNNDVIYVEKSPFAADIISFRIYDRWGNRVFEGRDISEGWDGTHDGLEMKPAVFVFVLEVPCLDDGSVAIIKGDITLLR